MESQSQIIDTNFQAPVYFNKKYWRRLICQLRGCNPFYLLSLFWLYYLYYMSNLEVFSDLVKTAESNHNDELMSREKMNEETNLIEL